MLKKNAVLFLTGGTVYPALEVLSRGRTDISMSIAGGVCLCLIDQICHKKMQNCSLAQRCAAGSGIITGIEFLTGVVVNIVLKMNVWDYSAMPGNILEALLYLKLKFQKCKLQNRRPLPYYSLHFSLRNYCLLLSL